MIVGAAVIRKIHRYWRSRAAPSQQRWRALRKLLLVRL